MNTVSSIYLFDAETAEKTEHCGENQNTLISLPGIFNCSLSVIRHGIILKDGSGDDAAAADKKIILLSTEVESEEEISSGKFYPLPEIMGIMQFSFVFKGMFFNDHSKLVLLLDTEQLVQNISNSFINPACESVYKISNPLNVEKRN